MANLDDYRDKKDRPVLNTSGDRLPRWLDRNSQYTTAEELASFVSITMETFTLLAQRAELKPIDVDGQTMYHRDQVKQFLGAWSDWNNWSAGPDLGSKPSYRVTPAMTRPPGDAGRE